jgi:hypothetical protein
MRPTRFHAPMMTRKKAMVQLLPILSFCTDEKLFKLTPQALVSMHKVTLKAATEALKGAQASRREQIAARDRLL